MKVEDFTFVLPEEQIAISPPADRDGARLLHVRQGGTGDHRIKELASLLKLNDHLVMNDTKVIPAQLVGQRPGRDGGPDISIDVMLHRRLSDDKSLAEKWMAFIRPAKRVKNDDILEFGAGLKAKISGRIGGEAELSFNLANSAFDAALQSVGAPPLPPYIARKRSLSPEDAERYQTIFAQESGSVAAPTAGLHFTDSIFASLASKKIGSTKITLHVGAGTFLPVSVNDTSDHKMHAEWGEISQEQADAINSARKNGYRIVAVGTTSLRLLESAVTAEGLVRPFKGETDIFITPGYQFKAVDAMLTNFHLPRSTLFMLVCAFSGIDKMKAAYAHAIKNGYRFYSYGDACLLERSDLPRVSDDEMRKND